MRFFLFTFFLSFLSVFSYDINQTRDLLHLAQASYCETTATKENWVCPVCDNETILEKVIENRGAKALVGYHTSYDALFVSFRGSENIENWIDNIQVSIIYPYEDLSVDSFNNIGIEKGFYKVFTYLYDDIMDTLHELSEKYKTTDIMTTGHSLGGIATIFAFEIDYFVPEFKMTALTTFGSPRMGNSEFAKWFDLANIPSTRVTHYYDMVPHVPQELLGYQHVSQEIWYNEPNTNYIICDGDEDKSCSNSCAPIHCTSTDDHMTYLNVQMGKDGDC